MADGRMVVNPAEARAKAERMIKIANELENLLLEKLKVTEDILNDWEINPYYMDSKVVGEFWDNIYKAPAVAIIGDYDVDGILSTYILYDTASG